VEGGNYRFPTPAQNMVDVQNAVGVDDLHPSERGRQGQDYDSISSSAPLSA
jgi:hypothetical protein